MLPAVCLLALLTPALSSAASTGAVRLAGRTAFGVSDENPAMFADPRFSWLGIRYARVIVPWDAARHRAEMGRARQWLEAAQVAGVQPLVAFDHSAYRLNLLPPVRAYAIAVRAFMRRFPSVRNYETWDEENQGGEPTSHDPARAAAYFNWLQAACRGCTVAAADLLDGPSMGSWLQRFLAHARNPRLWGVHPYYELAYGGHEALSMLTAQTHGEIWLTEAGLPAWRFVREEHRFLFASPAEQVRAVRRMLVLTRLTRRITRIYYYQWRSSIPFAASERQYRHHRHVSATWDSGLFLPDCAVRPTFPIVARALGRKPAQAPRARRANRGLACIATRPSR